MSDTRALVQIKREDPEDCDLIPRTPSPQTPSPPGIDPESMHLWKQVQQQPVWMPTNFEDIVDIVHFRRHLQLTTIDTQPEHFCAEVTRSHSDIPADCGGPLHAARVVIFGNGTAKLQVLFKDKITVRIFTRGPQCSESNQMLATETLEKLLDNLSEDYALCLGIPETRLPKQLYEFYSRQTDIVSIMTFPCSAVTSKNCPVWYKTSSRSRESFTLCEDCKAMVQELCRRCGRLKEMSGELLLDMVSTSSSLLPVESSNTIFHQGRSQRDSDDSSVEK